MKKENKISFYVLMPTMSKLFPLIISSDDIEYNKDVEVEIFDKNESYYTVLHLGDLNSIFITKIHEITKVSDINILSTIVVIKKSYKWINKKLKVLYFEYTINEDINCEYFVSYDATKNELLYTPKTLKDIF